METFFRREDYQQARVRVVDAIQKYKENVAAKLPYAFEIIEELMIASYQMNKIIKDGNKFHPEKSIVDYSIDEAVSELETQLSDGNLREEAWALETLSRVIFRVLPTALGNSLNLDDSE